MKNLGLSALSVGAALVCSAMPLSLHRSPTTRPSVSVDQAEARIGQRPSIAASAAGVSRRAQRRTYRRAAAGAAVGAAAVGAAATGAHIAGSASPPYYGPGYGYGPVAAGYGPGPGPAPAAYGPVVAGYGPAPAGAVVNPGYRKVVHDPAKRLPVVLDTVAGAQESGWTELGPDAPTIAVRDIRLDARGALVGIEAGVDWIRAAIATVYAAE